MKREILFSVTMHAIIIALVLFSAPFSIKPKEFDYDQVIKVSAVSMPQNTQITQPEIIEPIDVPEPSFEEENIEIPIEDPTTIDKPKPIDPPKKEEKPKPKPNKENSKKPRANVDKQQPKPATGNQTGEKEVDVSTGKGSPFGTATVDNASFDYPYWFDQAFNKIGYNFRNPVQADYKVVCVVSFDVIKSGKVFNLEIQTPSGVNAFDEACYNAVKKSSPLPPFPKDFQYEIVNITIPFSNQ